MEQALLIHLLNISLTRSSALPANTLLYTTCHALPASVASSHTSTSTQGCVWAGDGVWSSDDVPADQDAQLHAGTVEKIDRDCVSAEWGTRDREAVAVVLVEEEEGCYTVAVACQLCAL